MTSPPRTLFPPRRRPAAGGEEGSARNASTSGGWFRRLSLSTRLALLVLAILSPIAALTAYSAFDSRDSRKERTIEETRAYATSLSTGFETFAQDLESLGLAASLSLGATPGEITNASVQPYLGGLARQNPLFRAIFVTDLAGRVVAQQAGDNTGTDLSARPYIQELKAGAESTWSGGLEGLQSGQVTAAYARVVRTPEGVARGYLVVAFYPVNLQERLPPDLPRDSNLVLIDQHGQLIFSSRDPTLASLNRDESGSAYVQAALAGTPVTFDNDATPFDTGARFGVLLPLPTMKWVFGYTRSQSDLNASLQRTLFRDLGVLALIGLGAVVAIAVVARQVSRPLRQLAAAVARVPAGEVVNMPPVSGEPDIARLQEAFRRMSMDVHERETELIRANRAKDDFLGLVSHEIRTPVAIALAGASLLVKRGSDLGDVDREAVSLDVLDSAMRLAQLVDNLLVLARGQRIADVRREPMLVRPVLERVCEQQQRRRPGRPLDCRLDSPAIVLGSPLYLEQIATNLISNADKYSPASEPIVLILETEGSDAVLRVADSGPGLSEEDRGHLFEPYYRGTEARRAATGFGLGLAVCKSLSEALGWRLSYAERDQGAEFVLTMPLLQDGGQE